MIAGNYYNESIRKYIIIFATLFNDIKISRVDGTGTELQEFKVPVSYGPKQKFLARLKNDPDLTQPSAITLPRISFEILAITYDGQRKLNTKVAALSSSTTSSMFSPAPYDIEIELIAYSKNMEDGLRIIEQILPFFKPHWTPSAYLIDGIDKSWDVPIYLNSVTPSDVYEGNFEERRAIMWNFNFTIKGYIFGPTLSKKVIKFVNVNLYSSLTANTAAEQVYVQPGMNANGEPVTTSAESIDPTLINIDDDWAYVVEISEPTSVSSFSSGFSSGFR